MRPETAGSPQGLGIVTSTLLHLRRRAAKVANQSGKLGRQQCRAGPIPAVSANSMLR